MKTKLKYSASNMGPVKETFFLSAPVAPVEKRRTATKKYQSDEEVQVDGGAELVKMLLEALGRTEEFQYIRKLMLERTPVGTPGGEAAAEDPAPHHSDAEKDYVEKMSRYRRVGRDESPSMQYQKPRQVDPTELYERRQKAHAEVCEAYERFNESRKDVSSRAAQYAMAHGTDYATALLAIGSSLPTVPLPTAHV